MKAKSCVNSLYRVRILGYYQAENAIEAVQHVHTNTNIGNTSQTRTAQSYS